MPNIRNIYKKRKMKTTKARHCDKDSLAAKARKRGAFSTTTEIQSHRYAPSFKGKNNIIHIMTTTSPSQLVSSSKHYHKNKAEIQEQRKGYYK